MENKIVSKKHRGQKRDKEFTNRDTVEEHLQKEHTAEKEAVEQVEKNTQKQ